MCSVSKSLPFCFPCCCDVLICSIFLYITSSSRDTVLPCFRHSFTVFFLFISFCLEWSPFFGLSSSSFSSLSFFFHSLALLPLLFIFIFYSSFILTGFNYIVKFSNVIGTAVAIQYLCVCVCVCVSSQRRLLALLLWSCCLNGGGGMKK